MRDWGEESALFLASSLRPPPPILSRRGPRNTRARGFGFAAAAEADSLVTQDPIVEARANDIQAHLDEALADVYAFVPQTPEGLFALIDVFVAEEKGKMVCRCRSSDLRRDEEAARRVKKRPRWRSRRGRSPRLSAGGPAATGEGYYGRQDGATAIPGNLRALVAFPARIKSLAPPLERWGFLSKSSRAPLSFSTAALHAGTGA